MEAIHVDVAPNKDKFRKHPAIFHSLWVGGNRQIWGMNKTESVKHYKGSKFGFKMYYTVDTPRFVRNQIHDSNLIKVYILYLYSLVTLPQ